MNGRRTGQEILGHGTPHIVLVVRAVSIEGDGQEKIIFIIADEVEDLQIAYQMGMPGPVIGVYLFVGFDSVFIDRDGFLPQRIEFGTHLPDEAVIVQHPLLFIRFRN